MNLHFTEEQKIKFLEKHGYEIKKEKRTIYESCYHNQVDKSEEIINVLYKDGKQIPDMYLNHYTLGCVFGYLLEQKLKEFYLSL